VLQEIRRLAEPINAREGYHLDLKGSFNRGPKIAGADEKRLFAEWQACARANGITVGWQDVGGGSDGNLLSEAGLSSLDGVGIVGDHLHSPEEFADPTSILPRAAVAATFLERVAAGAIKLPPRLR
jgi:glutamate carboxypeptidase